MRKSLLPAVLLSLSCASAPAQKETAPTPAPAATSAAPETAASQAAPPPAATPAENLPPGEDDAKAALERSPRHGEYVEVKLASGAPMRTWVVYPERKEKTGVVILIMEIYGLSDWMRGVADAFAREGFIAVVPDLLAGYGPGGGGTESAATRDDIVKLVRGVTPEEAVARLNATRDWAVKLPASNGKTATVGFCWGGARSFEFAAAQPGLNAAVVYYGTSPDAAALAKVKAPVLGLYGGDDARVNATIDPARAEMTKLGKTYEPNVFEGAGHGFLRQQAGREGKNLDATRKAWPLTVAFLRKHLG
jgi:carboxymethylenebutenolidase